MGRLEGGVRRALRAAAVFGQTFWQGGVAALLGAGATQGATEVEKWLASAIHEELIQPHAGERSGDKTRAAGCYLTAAKQYLERGNLFGVLRQIERGVLCEPSFEQLGLFRSLESYVSLWLERHERIAETSALALERLPGGSRRIAGFTTQHHRPFSDGESCESRYTEELTEDCSWSSACLTTSLAVPGSSC